MNARRSSRRLLQLFLITAVALWVPACSKHKTPTAPLEPPASINATSVNVIAARGDTIATSDSRAIQYALEIPAGALTADATVSLGTSSVDYTRFSDIAQSTVPLSITSSAPFRDSIRLKVSLVATNPVAVSSVDGQFRYEALRLVGASQVVTILPPTSTGSGLQATAGGGITTWIGDVVDNKYELKAQNSVDLTDPTRPCVIVLHGLKQRAADMHELTNRIKAVFPTMTFTYPTFERTPRENASALKERLSALGPVRAPLILVGYSMGGLVARYFANLDDTGHWTRAVLYLAAPNDGVATSEVVNAWANALLNAGQLLPPSWRPTAQSLLHESTELTLLNQTGRTLDVDYCFFVGNCSCGLPPAMVTPPHDGLVSNASTDLGQYPAHEGARLHAANVFPLSHWAGITESPESDSDMFHDKAGLGDSLVNTLSRIASGGPDPGAPMVFVPAGSFTMGSTTGYPDEQPVHTVYLDAFYIDKYEVTNAQFKQFIDAGGYTTQAFWSEAGWSARSSGGWTVPYFWSVGTYHSGPAWTDFPVVGVSWYEAEAYANFVGKRLPTEAEWEKAARGTDQRTYPWGEGLDGSRANYWASGDPYDNNSTPVGFYDGRLHPSPSFQTTDSPSPYGAYDMAGNVWEWVADWYGAYSASPVSNPTGPLTGSYRVLRGGAWARLQHGGAGTLRSAYRYYDTPYDRIDYSGFRCARTLP
jgi:formylglycine-generating enzyme required for sulfatase activity